MIKFVRLLAYHRLRKLNRAARNLRAALFDFDQRPLAEQSGQAGQAEQGPTAVGPQVADQAEQGPTAVEPQVADQAEQGPTAVEPQVADQAEQGRPVDKSA